MVDNKRECFITGTNYLRRAILGEEAIRPLGVRGRWQCICHCPSHYHNCTMWSFKVHFHLAFNILLTTQRNLLPFLEVNSPTTVIPYHTYLMKKKLSSWIKQHKITLKSVEQSLTSRFLTRNFEVRPLVVGQLNGSAIYRFHV